MNGSIGGEKTMGAPGSGGEGDFALRPGEILGPYRIVRPLGRGGMGEVYLAEHDTSRTRYALKIIRPDWAGVRGFEERFFREANLMARLKHPNIVPCDDVGVARGLPWLAMEYVEGPRGEPMDLQVFFDERREQGKLLAESEAVAVGLQICEALACAHSYRDDEIPAGIVHRDLKPANILLGKETQLYVTDFGLARMIGRDFEQSLIRHSMTSAVSLGGERTIGAEAQKTTDRVGTFDYMSPEQREGREADARSDVYALGAILYELLTGRKVAGVPRRPTRVRPDLRPVWDEVVYERCLAADPEDRYGSAAELKAAILAVIGEEGSVPAAVPVAGQASELVNEPASGQAPESAPSIATEPTSRTQSAPTMTVPVPHGSPSSPRRARPGLTVAIAAGTVLVVGLLVSLLRPTRTAGPAARTSAPAAPDAVVPPGPGGTAEVPSSGSVASAVASAGGFAASAPAPAAVVGLWTNSLGMVFAPVSGTDVSFCIWETRVRDFEAFVESTGHDATRNADTLGDNGWRNRGGSWKAPGFATTPDHPVCCVSWDDANAFCAWLTTKERAEGRIAQDGAYRLPADWEWSVAVGLDEPKSGATPKEFSSQSGGIYPWGTVWPPPAGAGNYGGEEYRAAGIPKRFGVLAGYRDDHPHAAPVGSYAANRFGLHDLGGNVWEWCADRYDGSGKDRALRGASWSYHFTAASNSLMSAFRYNSPSDSRTALFGFRCVLVRGAPAAVVEAVPAPGVPAVRPEMPATKPADAVAPFGADEAHRYQMACAAHLGVPVRMTNSIGVAFVLIPPGKFQMGSPVGEDVRRKDELQHEVILSRPFYMSAHPITVGQFAGFVNDSGYRTEAEVEGRSFGVRVTDGRIMGDARGRIRSDLKIDGLNWRNPGFPQDADHPVTQVSWNDAQAFCTWLSRRCGMPADLPTEAQWEFAIRAGTASAWPWGSDPGGGVGMANGADASLKKILPPAGGGIVCFDWDDGYSFTSPVGKFAANAFGLHDAIGNVACWCRDQFGDYTAGSVTDPVGATGDANRIVRGGSWNNYHPLNCRSASRYKFAADFRNERYGFRVVLEQPAGTAAVGSM